MSTADDQKVQYISKIGDLLAYLNKNQHFYDKPGLTIQKLKTLKNTIKNATVVKNDMVTQYREIEREVKNTINTKLAQVKTYVSHINSLIAEISDISETKYLDRSKDTESLVMLRDNLELKYLDDKLLELYNETTKRIANKISTAKTNVASLETQKTTAMQELNEIIKVLNAEYRSIPRAKEYQTKLDNLKKSIRSSTNYTEVRTHIKDAVLLLDKAEESAMRRDSGDLIAETRTLLRPYANVIPAIHELYDELTIISNRIDGLTGQELRNNIGAVKTMKFEAGGIIEAYNKQKTNGIAAATQLITKMDAKTDLFPTEFQSRAELQRIIDRLGVGEETLIGLNELNEAMTSIGAHSKIIAEILYADREKEKALENLRLEVISVKETFDKYKHEFTPGVQDRVGSVLKDIEKFANKNNASEYAKSLAIARNEMNKVLIAQGKIEKSDVNEKKKGELYRLIQKAKDLRDRISDQKIIYKQLLIIPHIASVQRFHDVYAKVSKMQPIDADIRTQEVNELVTYYTTLSNTTKGRIEKLNNPQYLSPAEVETAIMIINTSPDKSPKMLEILEKLKKYTKSQASTTAVGDVSRRARENFNWNEGEMKRIDDKAKKIKSAGVLKPGDPNYDVIDGENSIIEINKKIHFAIMSGNYPENLLKQYAEKKPIVESLYGSKTGVFAKIGAFFAAIVAGILNIFAGFWGKVFLVTIGITIFILVTGVIVSGIIGVIQYNRGKIAGWEILLRMLMGWFYIPLLLFRIVD